MAFDQNKVGLVVEEDRLSSLPDDLIHKILYCFDTKFAIQTCLLSPRWKLLWTSIPFLNFNSGHFGTLQKFDEFVTNVLSRRNHQIEVSSVKLHFHGSCNQVFVQKIADYAFSQNVQELTLVRSFSHSGSGTSYPGGQFSSPSLKHFTLTGNGWDLCDMDKTPLDFPALTTLSLSHITFVSDLFSKFVNLKNLTLENFYGHGPKETVDIMTPHLSNLILIDGCCCKVLNVIAPELENLTIKNCSISYLNAPPGLSSFCYTSKLHPYADLLKFTNDRFRSLNKMSICLSRNILEMPYTKKDAHNTIKMLQQLHSARYLTLNVDIIECLSSFPDLVSQHPSPFSDLICLTIDSSRRVDVYKVKMSTEARNFLLENSPHATFIMEIPEKAKRAAEIESHLKELKELIEQGLNMAFEWNRAKENVSAALEIRMEQMNFKVGKRAHSENKRLKAKFNICVKEMRTLNEEQLELEAIFSKEELIRSLLENMAKQERTEVEAFFSRQLRKTKKLHERLLKILASEEIFPYDTF